MLIALCWQRSLLWPTWRSMLRTVPQSRTFRAALRSVFSIPLFGQVLDTAVLTQSTKMLETHGGDSCRVGRETLLSGHIPRIALTVSRQLLANVPVAGISEPGSVSRQAALDTPCRGRKADGILLCSVVVRGGAIVFAKRELEANRVHSSAGRDRILPQIAVGSRMRGQDLTAVELAFV